MWFTSKGKKNLRAVICLFVMNGEKDFMKQSLLLRITFDIEFNFQGPVDKYVLEASQFNPGQILTFRVQAVNSLFNGEFSDEYKFSIEHSVIEDTIENIQVASKSDSKVIIKWSKVTPKENSALNNGSTWFYRYIYLLLFVQCL
jgi:hypothetical protein